MSEQTKIQWCDCEGILRTRRIFSLSLGDWLDHEVPIEWLARLLDTIRRCDQVNWLLLTKRPENFFERINAAAGVEKPENEALQTWLAEWYFGAAPNQVWFGVSVENQELADKRIPELLKIPAAVRFLSVEPLLEEVNLELWVNAPSNHRLVGTPELPAFSKIDWVIVGGESGRNARPCNVGWIRSIKDQCVAAGVPCFVKQLGSDPYCACSESVGSYSANCAQCFPFSVRDKKGGDISEFPEDLRVRQFPKA